MKTIVQLVEEQKEYFLEKDTAAKQAVEANIAPVEADASSASRAYVVGEQLFLNDVLYDVTSPISVGDAIVVGTNITAANKLSADIQTLKNKVTDISEVMGKNGAKNKEPFDIDVVKALNTTGTWTGNSYALNGITFAFADDGKVTVSGTASVLCSINISGNYDLNGDYIITGCPSGGGSSTYSLRIYDSSATVVADDIGEGISFTANNLANCRTNIIVRKDAAFSTPIVFAPMIRDSKDPDATYQPYAKTNQELTAENQTLTNKLNNEATTRSAMGAKNLIPFDLASIKAKNSSDYPSGSWNNNEWTINGVTFAIQDDNTVVATGANTSNSNAQLDYYITIKGGVSYIANGCPSGGSDTTYRIANYCSTSPTETFVDSGNGVSITRAADTAILVHMQVKAGYTIDGQLVFKPMIRLATDSDATYQPYAKTNQELTAENQTLTSAFANNVNENGCKNILDVGARYRAGTIDSKVTIVDDVITVNGTQPSSTHFRLCPAENDNSYVLPAGTYIIVGESSDTNLAMSMKKNGNYLYNSLNPSTPREFTANGTDYFEVLMHLNAASYSNATMKLMICLKSDYEISPKWEPYTKTNLQLTQDSVTWDDLSEVGAVNYCKNKASSTTTTDGTTTFTWTVNDDKSVTVSAPSYPVTVASNQILIPWDNISADECSNLVGKVFKLSGCPSGGSRDTYRLQIYRVFSADGSVGTAEEYGEGNVFTWLNNGSGTKAKVQMVIASGYTMTDPITFKPMLTDPSYNGPYVPYAKTNKELTEINTTKDLTAQITNVNAKMTNLNYFLVRYGNVCSLRLYVGDSSDVTAWTEALMTIPSDCKPKSDIYIAEMQGTGKCIIIRSLSGDVNVIQGSETLHSAQFFCTWVVL